MPSSAPAEWPFQALHAAAAPMQLPLAECLAVCQAGASMPQPSAAHLTRLGTAPPAVAQLAEPVRAGGSDAMQREACRAAQAVRYAAAQQTGLAAAERSWPAHLPAMQHLPGAAVAQLLSSGAGPDFPDVPSEAELLAMMEGWPDE